MLNISDFEREQILNVINVEFCQSFNCFVKGQTKVLISKEHNDDIYIELYNAKDFLYGCFGNGKGVYVEKKLLNKENVFLLIEKLLESGEQKYPLRLGSLFIKDLMPKNKTKIRLINF